LVHVSVEKFVTQPPTPHVFIFTNECGEWRMCAPDEESLVKWMRAIALQASGKTEWSIIVQAPEGPGPNSAVHAPTDTAHKASSASTVAAVRRRSRGGAGTAAVAAGGGGGGGECVAQITTDGRHRTVGPAVVPTRFLEGCGMDADEALRRWKLTHEWRMAVKMDELLTRPPGRHAIDTLKTLYNHFYHRRAKNGHVVFYDVIDAKNQPKLLQILPWDE
jgi:hypothetical protein